MEKAISTVAEEMGRRLSSEEELTVLTRQAIVIAEVALTSLRGDLLEKALNISKAIVEYENELLVTN